MLPGIRYSVRKQPFVCPAIRGVFVSKSLTRQYVCFGFQKQSSIDHYEFDNCQSTFSHLRSAGSYFPARVRDFRKHAGCFAFRAFALQFVERGG